MSRDDNSFRRLRISLHDPFNQWFMDETARLRQGYQPDVFRVYQPDVFSWQLATGNSTEHSRATRVWDAYSFSSWIITAKRPGSSVLVFMMGGMTQLGWECSRNVTLISIIVFVVMDLFGNVDDRFNLAFSLNGHRVGGNASLELSIRTLRIWRQRIAFPDLCP